MPVISYICTMMSLIAGSNLNCFANPIVPKNETISFHNTPWRPPTYSETLDTGKGFNLVVDFLWESMYYIIMPTIN